MNDLDSVCEHTMAILFAGDMNLFMNGGDLFGTTQILNTTLGNNSYWLKVNKLAVVLKVKKTHCVIRTSKLTPKLNHVIRIESHKKYDEVQIM